MLNISVAVINCATYIAALDFLEVLYIRMYKACRVIEVLYNEVLYIRMYKACRIIGVFSEFL